MNISDEIAKKQFIQREYGLAHPTYDRELDFYRLVCSTAYEVVVRLAPWMVGKKKVKEN